VTRRILVLVTLAAVALLVLPATAQAKGASKATLGGGGLPGPVTIGGNGESGSGDLLARLAEQTGAYAAMYEDGGQQLDAARPSGDLGPRYLVTYTIPSPAGGEDAVRQELYPFAVAGPVSFTTAGQHFMDNMQTKGGWYHTPASLTETLAALGVRKQGNSAAANEAAIPAAAPPVTPTDSSDGSFIPLLLGAGLVALLLGGGGLLLFRRRSGPTS
jgi:LPXTG-motif cell wall-anchored protein